MCWYFTVEKSTTEDELYFCFEILSYSISIKFNLSMNMIQLSIFLSLSLLFSQDIL